MWRKLVVGRGQLVHIHGIPPDRISMSIVGGLIGACGGETGFPC